MICVGLGVVVFYGVWLFLTALWLLGVFRHFGGFWLIGLRSWICSGCVFVNSVGDLFLYVVLVSISCGLLACLC